MGERTMIPAHILLRDGYKLAMRLAEWLETQLTQTANRASRHVKPSVAQSSGNDETSEVVIRDLRDWSSATALAASLIRWVRDQSARNHEQSVSLSVTIGHSTVEIGSGTDDEAAYAALLLAWATSTPDLYKNGPDSPMKSIWRVDTKAIPHHITPFLVTGTTVPVTIYLSDEAGHEAVEEAVDKLLADAGAEVDDRDDPVFGSFFRSLRATFRNIAATPEGNETAKVAVHAADARLVHAQDARITATLADGLSKVLAPLQNTTNAVIRIGALLIVKVDGNLVVHQLTATQQLVLDHKPDLTMDPRNILAALALDANKAITTPQPSETPGATGQTERVDSD